MNGNIKNIKKIENVRIRNHKYCEYCGHTMTFYAFEPDKKCCDWCGRYNYRDEAAKFKDLLCIERRKVERSIVCE